MEYRNPQYNDLSTIDCEVNHPVHGWIPFTASPNDANADGAALYKTITESGETITAYTPEPAATRRTRAIALIDAKAGAVRAAYSSNGALVSAEYEQALASAKLWTEAGRPADAVPDDVQCWADATGNSAEWAAQDIIDTAAAWSEALTAIRRARLVGKQAVRNVDDDTDFDMIAAPYLEQLEQVATAAPTKV